MVAKLTSAEYLKQRAAEINPTAISETEKVRPGLEHRQTTHFSIVDADGNAVSNIYTLNLDYGSGVVVKGAGFLLNDERSEEHTSELQSLMRISYAVFCLK